MILATIAILVAGLAKLIGGNGTAGVQAANQALSGGH